MDQLPVALLFEIVEYLNPKERQRFSGTNQEHSNLFPVPLRIKITSKSSGSTLQERLFVSRRKRPEKMLLDDEELVFEEDYLFWTYDHSRENKVYLSRHGQKLLNTEYTQYMFTMGLRPKQPTQFVRVKGGEAFTKVKFGEYVGLDIGGQSAIPHTPDSKDRMYLSSQTLTVGALWYSIQRKWGNDEKLQLYRCQDHVCENDDRTTNLIIHAIPDICDGPCSLYSPRSLKDGRAACELHHVNVKFQFWVKDGLLCFQALVSTPFAFGVPMLEEDNATGIKDPIDSLKVLLKKNSSRWWAVKHYMSVAADLQAGSSLNLNEFVRTAKDHDDHVIIRDESKNLIYIEVQDATVETQIADYSKDENDVWEFLFCGG